MKLSLILLYFYSFSNMTYYLAILLHDIYRFFRELMNQLIYSNITAAEAQNFRNQKGRRNTCISFYYSLKFNLTFFLYFLVNILKSLAFWSQHYLTFLEIIFKAHHGKTYYIQYIVYLSIYLIRSIGSAVFLEPSRRPSLRHI